MGGSGGGGRRHRQGEDEGGRRGGDCEVLSFRTILHSPNLEVIRRLEGGSILSLEIERVGNYDTIVAKDNDQIAGTISPQDGSRLLACMSLGHRYKAQVLELNLSMCSVRVSHV